MVRGPLRLLTALLAAAGVALGAACAPSAPPPPYLAAPADPRLPVGPAACDTRFRIANAASVPVIQFFFSPASQRDWGPDQFGAQGLPPGAAVIFRAAHPGEYDFRVVMADRRSAELRRVNICTVVEITVTDTGLQASHIGGATVRAPRGPGGTYAGASPRGVPLGRVSTGTGFVVARGAVVTNLHVVEDCGRILVRAADGREVAVPEPARSDERRDLALLAVPADFGPPLSFRPGPVRRGEGVVTYGFPLAGLLSSGPTLTTGEVSALSGIGDNPSQIQISAPVQPGSSGGPLLDRQGQVVGMVVAKLNAARVAARLGDIPQNVNFAVRHEEVLEFLRESGIRPHFGPPGGRGERSAAEVGEIAHPSTVFIRCER
jgi:S1-C subfamily serine protease